MRWFKHMTDAHDDEFVQELMFKWQSDGYTAWFVTMELVAGKGVRDIRKGRWAAKLAASPRVFAEATKIAPDRLEVIYEYCSKHKKFSFKRKNEHWIIDWPKILKHRDEYTDKAMSKPKRDKSDDTRQLSLPDPAPPSEPLARSAEITQIVGLFEDETTRTRVLEWIGFLEHQPNVKNGRVVEIARTLHNLRQGLVNEGDSFPADRVMRYAMDQAVKHRAKSVEYVAKVVRSAIVKVKEGAQLV